MPPGNCLRPNLRLRKQLFKPKAASTDLTKLAAHMIGIDKMDADFQKIKSPTCSTGTSDECLIKITEENRNLINETTKGILFVREPMERIVAGYHRILNNRFESQEYYDAFTKPILNALRFNDQEIMPDTPEDAWDKVNDLRGKSI